MVGATINSSHMACYGFRVASNPSTVPGLCARLQRCAGRRTYLGLT